MGCNGRGELSIGGKCPPGQEKCILFCSAFVDIKPITDRDAKVSRRKFSGRASPKWTPDVNDSDENTVASVGDNLVV